MPNDFLCPICGSSSEILFQALQDHLYEVEYRADLYACRGESCHHIFVAPEPTSEQIAGFYKTYSTHTIAQAKKSVVIQFYDRVCNMFGAVDHYARQKQDLAYAGLQNRAPAKILDVGCGSGALLQRLVLLGWRDCYGIDFDLNAVNIARSRGLDNVKVASLAALKADAIRYDYILLNHVVEHLPNPEYDLRLATSLLNQGGRLIIRTPNNQSLLARVLKSKWRGWEPPRHLHVFSRASLRMLARKAGLEVVESYTSNGMLQGTFFESIRTVAAGRNVLALRLIELFARLIFPMAVFGLSLLRRFNGDTGEELVVILEKQSVNPAV